MSNVDPWQHDIRSYEPLGLKDRVLVSMATASVIGLAATAGTMIIETVPQLVQVSASAEQDPLAHAKEQAALAEKLTGWLNQRDQTLNVHNMVDPRYDQGEVDRTQLANQLGLHFFRYNQDRNRSPQDELKVFTAFVAQYGMEVAISNDPKEKPTPEQLNAELAKDSMQTFSEFLEEMPKEYITDVANIKKLTLFSMPPGSGALDYAAADGIHMSINVQTINDALGHEIGHGVDASSHGSQTTENDPEFEGTAALPSERAQSISLEKYEHDLNNFISSQHYTDAAVRPGWCTAQQKLAREAERVTSASDYKPNAVERKAEVIWRLLSRRVSTMFNPNMPHLYDAALLELERIYQKSPAVGEWIARTQKPVKDLCHLKPWE